MTRSKLVAGVLVVVTAGALAWGATSELWGEHGEKWTAQSRLPDFSFAGYHSGEAAIPQVAGVTDVKKFGAVGDGATDDTRAFRQAIKATAGGAILIPEGRYVLTDIVTINKPNIVLRGAGAEKTVLVIPRPLGEIHPAKAVDTFKSKYAFSGGFIAFDGDRKMTPLPDLAAGAKRGERKLTLKEAATVKVGTMVRLAMNNSPSLGRHVHADQLDVGKDTPHHANFVDWVARVAAVEGTSLVLDRPLRLDVRMEWGPKLWVWEPGVTESGVEDLGFEFAGVPKKPHLREEGFNAIDMRGVANCWIRNVTVVDADNGVIVGSSRFCTIEGMVFKVRKRTAPSGHHALWATGHSQDCLFTDFRVETRYVHDLTVEGFACGNVFMKGRGQSLNFDHHRNGPYENLFTDLDAGDGRRLWESSGREDRGPHSGARETVWNIRHSAGEKVGRLAGKDFPQVNVVGVKGFNKNLDPTKHWYEPVDNLEPANLYEAQLHRRLGK